MFALVNLSNVNFQRLYLLSEILDLSCLTILNVEILFPSSEFLIETYFKYISILKDECFYVGI